MNKDRASTDWRRLCDLAAYELNTPLVVMSGYARMLKSPKLDASLDTQQVFTEILRAGESANQVTVKMRELVEFETTGQHWAAVKKTEVSLEDVVRNTIATPGPRWDPRVAIDVLINLGETVVMAHADPLKRAVLCVLSWVCGELGRKARYTMHIRIADSPQTVYRNIVVAETADMTRAAVLPDARLEAFNDYQDASGLDLPLATRTIAAHGGQIWWLEGTIGARIALPLPLNTPSLP